jgi:hypothetical protein
VCHSRRTISKHTWSRFIMLQTKLPVVSKILKLNPKGQASKPSGHFSPTQFSIHPTVLVRRVPYNSKYIGTCKSYFHHVCRPKLLLNVCYTHIYTLFSYSLFFLKDAEQMTHWTFIPTNDSFHVEKTDSLADSGIFCVLNDTKLPKTLELQIMYL